MIMSRGANLSIMGLYNNDNSIFDLMAFPDGFTNAQKQTTIENILIDCAELEVLYPNPTVMKNIIAIWSKKEKPYWNRVYQASMAEYNPIENYRRTETETVEDDRTEQHSGQDVNTASGTDTDARTGTETLNKTGTQKTDRTGTETLNKTGTEKTDRTGTETRDHDASHRTLIDELTTDTLSGSDQLKKTGTDSDSGSSSSTDTNSGTDTVTNKITGFDSNTLVVHDESDTVHGHVVTNAAQGSNTKTYNTTDKTEYGRVDTTDHDNDIQETHDDTDTLTLNTEDETTFNTQDQNTLNTEDETTFNTQDQNTLNTLETFVHGKTDTLTHGEKIEHDGTTERSMLAYGNIGVTTSQEMLTQELELAKIIEVIPIIIHSFQDRFCLMVY